MLTIATSLIVLTILRRTTVGLKATMAGQRMQQYAETNLGGHVSAAHSNAFMNIYGLNSSTYSELYASYRYLVTLSVTQVECERSLSTLNLKL